MRLPLRRTRHCLDGRATWRPQHCNDVSFFACAPCSRLRRGPRWLMSRWLCNGLELSGLACGGSLYTITGLGLAVVCARCGLALGLCLGHRNLLRLCGNHRRHHRSPTSANKPAGQDPKRSQRLEPDTLPLYLREEASPFWIILLLVERDLEHPSIKPSALRLPPMSAFGGKADMTFCAAHVCF